MLHILSLMVCIQLHLCVYCTCTCTYMYMHNRYCIKDVGMAILSSHSNITQLVISLTLDLYQYIRHNNANSQQVTRVQSEVHNNIATASILYTTIGVKPVFRTKSISEFMGYSNRVGIKIRTACLRTG